MNNKTTTIDDIKSLTATDMQRVNDEITSRSLSMYKMFMHAIDLGAKPDEIEHLMRDLNEFWVNPIETDRLDKYINQMRDIYIKKHQR